MERLENFKLQLIIVMVAQLLAAIILFMCGLQQIALIVAGVVIVNILIVIWIMARMEKEKRRRTWISPACWERMRRKRSSLERSA